MKRFIVTLSTLAVLASSALAGDSLVINPNGRTYEERYGVPRFSPAELAQRQRDDEDYERNGKLYEKLDEINEKLDAEINDSLDADKLNTELNDKLDALQSRLSEIDDQ